MDEYQRIVAEAYEGGEFVSKDLTGDGLFDFLIREVSEKEGVDSIGEAMRRLDTVIKQVEEVRRAFDRRRK